MSNSTTSTWIDPALDPYNGYGYYPSKSIGVLFVVLFAISTIIHAGQATYYRMWWLFPTACLCGVGELIGWSGRLWSAYNVDASDPFMMQISATIISPTPLIAVNFILLSRIVEYLGPCYSRISALWYTIVFVTCDVVALVIQGAGGGIAASAPDGDRTQATMGTNIMLAGIAFQFFAICTYTLCGLEYLRWYTRDLPVCGQSPLGTAKVTFTPRIRLMISAFGFSTLVLFIRSPAAGTAQSFSQVYFLVFDGGMVTLAIYTMNIAHPGYLLGPILREKNVEKEVESIASSRV
ncbi:RTA1 like protein-domain-containing protein [Mycena leptocephala]|nr:RTA1 like protein-domain-containing protein [Mycena leptocephala]